MFNRKKKISVDLINFSIMHTSTGKIGGYIVEFLYKELEFNHIGYRIENIDGDARCFLYTTPDNKKAIRYFNDRCSGMIEEKVQTMSNAPHRWDIWSNGFEEICG